MSQSNLDRRQFAAISDVEIMRIRFAVQNGWTPRKAAKLSGHSSAYVLDLVACRYRKTPRDIDQLARDLGLAK